jgi:hypothetical protein
MLPEIVDVKRGETGCATVAALFSSQNFTNYPSHQSPNKY